MFFILKNEVIRFSQKYLILIEFYNLLFVILPGVLCALIFNNAYFYLASFFSIACIIPYGKSFQEKAYCFITLLFSLCVSYLSVIYPQYSYLYWTIIFIISIVLGYAEANLSSLRTLSSWLFIGLLYGHVLLSGFSIEVNQKMFLLMFLVGLLSVCLYVLFAKVSINPIQKIIFTFHQNKFCEYAKYSIFIALGLACLQMFHLNEPQWFLWSGLSVLSLNLNTTLNKLRHRVIYGCIGIVLGCVVIQLLPNGTYLTVISYVGILLSLRVFQHYQFNFATRCFFIVLLAGNNYLSIGSTRIVDVIAGGVLGLFCSVVLAYVNRRL